MNYLHNDVNNIHGMYNRNTYHSLNHTPSPYQNLGFNIDNNTHQLHQHTHHYHQQNLTGINNFNLPINAKYPGDFSPITLQTTASMPV